VAPIILSGPWLLALVFLLIVIVIWKGGSPL
jgi:hypothetical protein